MVIGYLGCPTHCGNPLLLLGTPLLRSYCAGCTLFLLLSWREMNLYHSPRVTSNTRRCRCIMLRFPFRSQGRGQQFVEYMSSLPEARVWPYFQIGDADCAWQGWVRLDVYLANCFFLAFSLFLMFSLVFYSELLEQVVVCWKREKINSRRVLNHRPFVTSLLPSLQG
jgi:hypothetical protein